MLSIRVKSPKVEQFEKGGVVGTAFGLLPSYVGMNADTSSLPLAESLMKNEAAKAKVKADALGMIPSEFEKQDLLTTASAEYYNELNSKLSDLTTLVNTDPYNTYKIRNSVNELLKLQTIDPRLVTSKKVAKEYEKLNSELGKYGGDIAMNSDNTAIKYMVSDSKGNKVVRDVIPSFDPGKGKLVYKDVETNQAYEDPAGVLSRSAFLAYDANNLPLGTDLSREAHNTRYTPTDYNELTGRIQKSLKEAGYNEAASEFADIKPEEGLGVILEGKSGTQIKSNLSQLINTIGSMQFSPADYASVINKLHGTGMAEHFSKLTASKQKLAQLEQAHKEQMSIKGKQTDPQFIKTLREIEQALVPSGDLTKVAKAHLVNTALEQALGVLSTTIKTTSDVNVSKMPINSGSGSGEGSESKLGYGAIDMFTGAYPAIPTNDAEGNLGFPVAPIETVLDEYKKNLKLSVQIKRGENQPIVSEKVPVIPISSGASFITSGADISINGKPADFKDREGNPIRNAVTVVDLESKDASILFVPAISLSGRLVSLDQAAHKIPIAMNRNINLGLLPKGVTYKDLKGLSFKNVTGSIKSLETPEKGVSLVDNVSRELWEKFVKEGNYSNTTFENIALPGNLPETPKGVDYRYFLSPLPEDSPETKRAKMSNSAKARETLNNYAIEFFTEKMKTGKGMPTYKVRENGVEVEKYPLAMFLTPETDPELRNEGVIYKLTEKGKLFVKEMAANLTNNVSNALLGGSGKVVYKVGGYVLTPKNSTWFGETNLEKLKTALGLDAQGLENPIQFSSAAIQGSELSNFKELAESGAEGYRVTLRSVIDPIRLQPMRISNKRQDNKHIDLNLPR